MSSMTTPTLYGTIAGGSYHRHDCDTLERAAERGTLIELDPTLIAVEQRRACNVCKPPRPEGAVTRVDVVNVAAAAAVVVDRMNRYRDAQGVGPAAALSAAFAFNDAADVFEALTGLDQEAAMVYAQQLVSTESSVRAAVLPF